MFLETQRGSIVVSLAGIGGMQNERSTAIWLRAASPQVRTATGGSGARTRKPGFPCPTGTR